MTQPTDPSASRISPSAATVSRRRFLRLAGLGVAATSVLAACAPAAPAARPPSQPGPSRLP